jgi:hypothetical protein
MAREQFIESLRIASRMLAPPRIGCDLGPQNDACIQDTLDTVQEIREFHNYLIHEEAEIRRRFTLDEASGHLILTWLACRSNDDPSVPERLEEAQAVYVENHRYSLGWPTP